VSRMYHLFSLLIHFHLSNQRLKICHKIQRSQHNIERK
jgi:hypothetical protein